MAEKDPGTTDESSLELPSFGLRRRKRKRDAAGAADAAPPEHDVPPAGRMPDEGAPGTGTPEAEVRGEEATPTPTQSVGPVAEAGPAAAPVVPDRSGQAASGAAPAIDEEADEPTVVIEEPVALEKPDAARTAAPSPAAAAPAVDEDAREDAGDSEDVDDSAEGSRFPGFVLPALGGMTAAVVTGLVIGLAMVGLTALALRGCSAVNGTSSCGGPGFFLLLAILVTLVFAGGALLRAWNVSDPGSTSFLAIGVTTVIALVFLVEVLLDWWMVIVIPLVSMLSFALSHWVATTFAEPAGD